MSKNDTKNSIPKFVPDATQSSKRIYSNFASVSSTGLYFTISFADVPPATKKQVDKVKKGEEIQIPLQCQIVIPNDLVPALINALKEQYERYEGELTKTKDKRPVEASRQSNKN